MGRIVLTNSLFFLGVMDRVTGVTGVTAVTGVTRVTGGVRGGEGIEAIRGLDDQAIEAQLPEQSFDIGDGLAEGRGNLGRREGGRAAAKDGQKYAAPVCT